MSVYNRQAVFISFCFLTVSFFLCIVRHRRHQCHIYFGIVSFFTPMKTCLKKLVEIWTCNSSTATSHTDSVSSSPAIPEWSAAAEENPDRRPVVAAFQSSCAALPLPSKHTKNPLWTYNYLYAQRRGRSTHQEIPTSFWAKRSSIFSSRVLLKVSVLREVSLSSMAKYTWATLRREQSSTVDQTKSSHLFLQPKFKIAMISLLIN